MVDVKFSPYELKGKLGNSRQGALLKVTFNHGGIGYADCHLWPELGDPSLDEMMGHIRFKRNDHPYFQNMIINAYIDLKCRERKEPLDYNRHYMMNHYLFTDVDALSNKVLEQLEVEGFTHIKLKVGRDVEKELARLTDYFSYNSPLKIRLDFNSLLTRGEYLDFIHELTLRRIPVEFCEDPFPYDNSEWIKAQTDTGVQIAADRYSDHLFTEKKFPFVIVVKPAVDDIRKVANSMNGQKFVVTSYLDHPIGQVAAAYHTQFLDLKFPKNGMCHGLLSHHVYEPTDYSRQLTQKGPYFVFPKGYGVGFEELLRKEQWIR